MGPSDWSQRASYGPWSNMALFGLFEVFRAKKLRLEGRDEIEWDYFGGGWSLATEHTHVS